ncbi:MAG: ABC transporter ATP-binding protein [Chloroflexota bacterium]|nr:ABC transporter ATP-binding protein [Chloroflexota bacterium]
MSYAVELRDITKRFPGVLANDHIDLTVARGEIRALVGENGAGKTTLMRILYGLYQPDEGAIYVRGERVTFHSPLDAIRVGLGMIHQQFMLFPSLTVTENVIFGTEPTQAGFVDAQEAVERVAALAQRYGLRVDPRARVGQLPVGVRQRVEILKTLYRNAEIIIMDEPTAVLTPQERDTLFEILKGLAAQGKTILFITHKLDEVLHLSDHATVLRDGRVVATVRTEDTSAEELSRHMVGRDVLLRVEKAPLEPGAAVLRVEDLVISDSEGRAVVRDLSFQVRAGEIVGIAGVAGNGQTELIEGITGLRPVERGNVILLDRAITHLPVAARRAAGLAYIPEDRVERGVAIDAKVADNLVMGYHARPPISQGGILRPRAIYNFASRLIERFAVKVPNPTERTANLSGGNLQKVVVARELSHQAPLLIAEQPTRGVDVGSIEFIHKQLIDYRNAGNAILLVSADLNEIMTLSDRILVIFQGQFVGEVAAAAATEEALGLLMAGARPARSLQTARAIAPYSKKG